MTEIAPPFEGGNWPRGVMVLAPPNSRSDAEELDRPCPSCKTLQRLE